jgi:putative intracellular protease/amidase
LPKVYGVLIYDGLTTLDIMGPLAFFNNVPGVQIFFIHDTLDPVPSGNVTRFLDESFAGQFYQPAYTMDTAPPLDVLVVPGGFTGTAIALRNPAWENYIATVYPSLRYLFTVCTGSALAARSGILDGRKATTNKAAFRWVETLGGNVNWIALARWVVDGNIWTSSGELP